MLEHMKSQYQQVKYRVPEEELARKSRQEELEEILHQLPERMRSILYLREIQGLSYKELETALNLNASQVKTTLHRAREKFRMYEMKKGKGESVDE